MMMRIDYDISAVLNRGVITLSPVRNRILNAVLAVALACSAVACMTGPRETDAQRQADKETAERVQEALNADDLLYARHISVHARNGTVRLAGYVWSQPDLEEAKRITAGVEGVKTIVDDLELELNGLGDSPVSR
jgi:osmotically-inducible protein OsmY